MKLHYWYRYKFADGYTVVSQGFSESKLAELEQEHGKLLRTTYEGRY